MIHSIGAELVENVEDAATATHIIVSDGKAPLRRTPKLMICISKARILETETGFLFMQPTISLTHCSFLIQGVEIPQH
jgi:hypothetical protein